MRNRNKTATAAVAEPSATEAPLDRLLDAPVGPTNDATPQGGLCTGTIAAVDPDGTVRVAVAGRSGPVCARALTHISTTDVGKDVVVGFEGGVLERPIVIGILGASPFDVSKEPAEITVSKQGTPDKVEIDGQSLLLTAEKEIVLRCGEASITLTRAGKIIIRGAYVLSRSSGVNRIKGGVVHIN